MGINTIGVLYMNPSPAPCAPFLRERFFCYSHVHAHPFQRLQASPFHPRPCAAPDSLALALAASGAVHAQGAQDGVTHQLDSVVVTASGFEQQIKEAPASISVITREELETKPFHNLADAVADVEA